MESTQDITANGVAATDCPTPAAAADCSTATNTIGAADTTNGGKGNTKKRKLKDDFTTGDSPIATDDTTSRGKKNTKKRKLKERNPPKKEKANPRCYYKKTASKLKNLIKEHHHEGLRNTPFGPMFEAIWDGDKKDFLYYPNNNNGLEQIASSYKEGQIAMFGKTFAFKAEDLSLLGIGGGTDEVKDVKNEDESWFGDFLKSARPAPDRIVAKMEAIKDDFYSKNDFIKYACCYLLTTVLAPNANGIVCKKDLQYVSNLGRMKELNWRKYIFERVEAGLKRGLGYFGCTMLLPVVVCERTMVVEPVKNIKIKKPAYLKYDIRKLYEHIEKLNQSDLGRYADLNVSQYTDEGINQVGHSADEGLGLRVIDPPKYKGLTHPKKGMLIEQLLSETAKLKNTQIAGRTEGHIFGDQIVIDAETDLFNNGVALEKGTRLVPEKKQKLLILDLNGVLVEKVGTGPYWKIRPYCKQFWDFVLNHFDLAVWSSKLVNNVREVLHDIDKDWWKKLRFCWGQDMCTLSSIEVFEKAGKKVMFKDMNKVWENHRKYNSSNTLLVDDSPYKAFLNSGKNAIFPKFDEHDTKFLKTDGEFAMYLQRLSRADNVAEFIEKKRFGQDPIKQNTDEWRFYSDAVKNIEKSR